VGKEAIQTSFADLLDSGQFWDGFALTSHQKITFRNRFIISDPTLRLLFTVSFYGETAQDEAILRARERSCDCINASFNSIF
jgi:hypothetical protein